MEFFAVVFFPSLYNDVHKWFAQWIILLSLKESYEQAWSSKLESIHDLCFPFFIHQKYKSLWLYILLVFSSFSYFVFWRKQILNWSFWAKCCLERPKMSIVTRISLLFHILFIFLWRNWMWHKCTLTNSPKNPLWWTTNTHLVW